MAVSPARCLVTGASSQLGSCLTKLLVAQGHSVGILVRPESNLWRLDGTLDRVSVLYGTLSEPQASAAAINRFAADSVFHLAWEGVDKASRNNPTQISTNLVGSLAWLEAAVAGGAKCFVGVGSQAEYGPHNGKLKEDLPLRPIDLYGAAKMSLGTLLVPRCKLSGVSGAWLRLLAAYGPADEDRNLIPYVIRTLLRREIPQLSAGTQPWDYLYVTDAAEALAQVASTRTEGIFNLARGDAWHVRRIAEFIRDAIDPELSLSFDTLRSGAGLQADISALMNATGWVPRTTAEEGLKRTIEWYRTRQ